MLIIRKKRLQNYSRDIERNSRCRFPQGEELLHTLEVYFAVNGNQRRMAETLYIHYNTVPIRLNKIQDVTGLSLHREEDRILLELAIYLRKFFS